MIDQVTELEQRVQAFRTGYGAGQVLTAAARVPGTGTALEVFLGPGDVYFGTGDTRIRTLLGSCVAVTLWHPGARIGGMCHYVLPTRRVNGAFHELSGHYADEALLLLLNGIRATSTSPQEYQVKMFGGGRQFSATGTMNVAARNVEAGLELLKRYDLRLKAMHFGGTGHRQVILDLQSGYVWVRHVGLADQGV